MPNRLTNRSKIQHNRKLELGSPEMLHQLFAAEDRHIDTPFFVLSRHSLDKN